MEKIELIRRPLTEDITKRGVMKIIHPEGLQRTQPGHDYPKKEPVGSSGFDHVLRKALGNTDSSGDVQKASRLSEPLSVHGFGEPGLQTGYIDKTSRVINRMDTYAKALSNPQKTLKDIVPELTAFIEEAQSLHEEYVSAGHTNPELKHIMEDLLWAARLESARFHRGDYMDPE